jgi:hypothetical protein
MALLNMATDTKFQFIAKVIEISEKHVNVTDGSEEISILLMHEDHVNLKAGDIVIVFGEKVNSKIQEDHILKLDLDWDLFKKTQEYESR